MRFQISLVFFLVNLINASIKEFNPSQVENDYIVMGIMSGQYEYEFEAKEEDYTIMYDTEMDSKLNVPTVDKNDLFEFLKNGHFELKKYLKTVSTIVFMSSFDIYKNRIIDTMCQRQSNSVRESGYINRYMKKKKIFESIQESFESICSSFNLMEDPKSYSSNKDSLDSKIINFYFNNLLMNSIDGYKYLITIQNPYYLESEFILNCLKIFSKAQRNTIIHQGIDNFSKSIGIIIIYDGRGRFTDRLTYESFKKRLLNVLNKSTDLDQAELFKKVIMRDQIEFVLNSNFNEFNQTYLNNVWDLLGRLTDLPSYSEKPKLTQEEYEEFKLYLSSKMIMFNQSKRMIVSSKKTLDSLIKVLNSSDQDIFYQKFKWLNQSVDVLNEEILHDNILRNYKSYLVDADKALVNTIYKKLSESHLFNPKSLLKDCQKRYQLENCLENFGNQSKDHFFNENSKKLTSAIKNKMFDKWSKSQLVYAANNLFWDFDKFKEPCSQYSFNQSSGVLVYFGHTCELNLIGEQINKNDYIKKLKEIRVFTTHNIFIRGEFKLKKEKYESDSPNLYLISPTVAIVNEAFIDLSCKQVPIYPIEYPFINDKYNQFLKAYHGFKGGNLIVITQKLDTYSKSFLRVRTRGGDGYEDDEDYSFYELQCRGYRYFYKLFNGAVKIFENEKLVDRNYEIENNKYYEYCFYKNINETVDDATLYKLATDYLFILTKFQTSTHLNTRYFKNTNFIELLLKTFDYGTKITDLLRRIDLLNNDHYRHLLPLVKNNAFKLNIRLSTPNNNEKVVVNYILAFISSIIAKDAYKHEFVIDIESFLIRSIEEMKEMNDVKNEQYRDAYQREYVNDLKKRIENSGNLIELLINDIQTNEHQMNNDIKQAENEILKLREEKNRNETEMRQKMESLKRKKWRKSILGVVKTGSNLLNFLGPKGMIISSILNMAVDVTDNLFDTFDSKKRFKRDDDEDKKNPDKIETIGKTFSDGFETYKAYKEVDKEMDELLETMEKNQEAIDELNNRQLEINQIQIEIVQEIKSAISELASNASKSHAQLDYQKYKIKKTLDSLRVKINKILKLFDDSKNELINTLTRYDNAISTMIDIYSRIENTKDHIEFVGYLSVINNPRGFTEGLDFSSNKYTNEIIKLESKIRENILKEIYSKAMQAFRYWSFPFNCFYLEKIKLPKTGTNDINNLIKENLNTLNSLLTFVQKDKMSINAKIDNYILTSHFSPRYPFYKWSFNESQFEIQSLFNPNSYKATFPTFLDTNQITSLNALKFSSIYILIEAHSSQAKNETLNRILSDFRVELKYVGYSFYKFRSNTFVIPMDSIENEDIILGFNYGCTISKCYNLNQSFLKFTNGKAILSPFTTWEISLIPFEYMSNNEKKKLSQELKSVLKDDLSDITLKLCGVGQFINRKYDQINMNC